MRSRRTPGFTLVELLVVVVVTGVIASVALSMPSSGDPQKLGVAAEETANLLRFAASEANRSGGYVLVDGKTSSGHLMLYQSDSSGNPVAAIVDPLTKRAMDIDINASPFSQGVSLTPQFIAGGGARPQLLIGPTGLIVLDSPSNFGPLQPNSGVLLSYAGQSAIVQINEVTGLVTLP